MKKTSERASKSSMVEDAAQETTDYLKRVDNKSEPNNLQDAHGNSHRNMVEETCDLIAELSESILEQPDAAFSANDTDGTGDDDGVPSRTKGVGGSKMRQLLVLAGSDGTRDEYTARLAIMSLLAVWKDILPAYRIRLPTKQELTVKVSRDTKKLWDYERALLGHYQQYLKLLEKTWNRGKNGSATGPSGLAVTAILSLAELLKSAFHFNFRSNLLTAVVRNMNCPDSQVVREACCEAVEHVFVNDVQGEVSLEAARQVAKMIKDRNLKVHAVVVRTFAKLPLRVHVDEAQAAKLAAQANSKKRKRDREIGEIEAEMKEGRATVDKIIMARCQSDTLQAVILTYFRVLKSVEGKSRRELLPAVLEGLAKFAHLINIDTVMDLLSVLKELLKDVDSLPLDAGLNCVLTAFETLQGPGKELKIDQKEYIAPLYTQLLRLGSETHCRRHTDLVLRCLTAAFIKRREYSAVRVAAFLKQIFTTSLHTPPSTSVPLVALARQLLQRYPSAHQLLENEEDAVASGQYNPLVQDPEESNPSTSAWELATLRFHVHPAVASQASSAASLKLLQMPAEHPDRLRNEILQSEDELYIPFNRMKKKHPLDPGKQTGSGAKKRRPIRFIKPLRAGVTLAL